MKTLKTRSESHYSWACHLVKLPLHFSPTHSDTPDLFCLKFQRRMSVPQKASRRGDVEERNAALWNRTIPSRMYLSWLFTDARSERETGCVVAGQQRAVLSSAVLCSWENNLPGEVCCIMCPWSVLCFKTARLCAGAKAQHSLRLGQMKTCREGLCFNGLLLVWCFCFRWLNVKHFWTSFYLQAVTGNSFSETFSP